ncbi:MAG TPA: hypothetical protein VMI94_13850 [Bryobacteraceae bacterium]|nr:hypothetical protein [Bryobacteraceae bacterium]
MRKALTHITIGVLVAAIGAFAADNSLGTWKLNMEKSRFSPSTPVKSLTATREASDGAIKVTTTGERADGTPINSSYVAKYDGSESPVTGAPYDTIAIKQVNANTFTYSAKKKDGKYSVTGRSVVSKDGKTMTNTIKGTDTEGKPYRATMVWDKQ